MVEGKLAARIGRGLVYAGVAVGLTPDAAPTAPTDIKLASSSASSQLNCDPIPNIRTPDYALTRCRPNLIRIDIANPSSSNLTPEQVGDAIVNEFEARDCDTLGLLNIRRGGGVKEMYAIVPEPDCITQPPKQKAPPPPPHVPTKPA